MLNAGKYRRRISISQIRLVADEQGFEKPTEVVISEPYAAIKTTRGYTLVANNSDFEKATTNFTIRYSQTVVDAYYNSDESNRDMFISYNGKRYKVQYLNNIDEQDVELEMQAREVMK